MARDKDVCGISAVMAVTGMKRKDILKHIELGVIKAAKRNRLYVFDMAEKNRLKELHDNYAGFFLMARKYTAEGSRFSMDRLKCRNELVLFASENSWFGADVLPLADVCFADTGNEEFFVLKADENLFACHLRLWMASYGESPESKLWLLLNRIKELYPTTGNLLSRFIAADYPDDYTAAWILTDFLCSELSCEITMSDDTVLDFLAETADKNLPLNAARMYSAFVTYLRTKRKLGNGWSYQFKSRGGRQENSAYPCAEFIQMAYIIFNEDAWESNRLIEKALRSEACANLWLFIAFHFICGWRGSDIVRIPMPALPCGGETMRERIAAGLFDAVSLLDEIELRLRYAPMKPSKTEGFNVPELKLFVAESLRKPLSLILAIAASHHDSVLPGGIFIRRAGSFSELQGFFGELFTSACDCKKFSTRRANKSYLQGIEAFSANEPGKPKGYMLAALARSHKGGYGALPQTTEIYLRDARFSGYSPEFIAREMFERGVFSFIPALLLDMYDEKNWGRLPVHTQTTLIKAIGISPSGIEGLTYTVGRALVKARQAVAEIMEHPLEMRESIEEILQNIASGNAPGRQDGILCLRTAAGFGCAAPDRSCCIGCGYEIYTKSILRLLITEYTRLLAKKRCSVSTEAARCDALLKKAVLPAISEMITAASRLYPAADIKPLLEELERGLGL